MARLEEQVRELKARLDTNSNNSSLPPSANPPNAPKPSAKPPTGRKAGGQPGHEGHARERLPAQRVNVVVPYVPATCEHCQAPLPAEPGPQDPEPTWHQVAELPAVTAIITEYQGHARTCACCGHVTRASIPAEVCAHGFGPKLAAAVVFLSGRCHGSKRLVSEMVEVLFGVSLSAASVCNLEAEVTQALAPAYAQAAQVVRTAAVKNTDETGWSQAGKLCWLWMGAPRWWPSS
jgi:transposase